MLRYSGINLTGVAIASALFSLAAQASAIDLLANERPVNAPVSTAAVALLPSPNVLVTPGTLTVATSSTNSPPLALLASDNQTRIGSDPDIARLIADGLGLKLKLVPASWEEWPLGLTSRRYDVAMFNIAVTEERKQRFDFAVYRADNHAFVVKKSSAITRINQPAEIAGKRIIVASGTNQERILLKWDEENRAKGLPPVEPIYLTDDASATLSLLSGRADAQFGPHSIAAYKAALNGQTRLVGSGPFRAWVAVTTKKGNRLAAALSASLNSAIDSGRYAQVLARWGEQDEAVKTSVINPEGIHY